MTATSSPTTPKKKTYIIQDGQRVGHTEDRDLDGIGDRRITYVFDDNGKRIGLIMDKGNDGVADTVTYERAARGAFRRTCRMA